MGRYFLKPNGAGHASKIFESKGGYFSFFLFSSSGCAAVVFLGKAAGAPLGATDSVHAEEVNDCLFVL